MTRGLVDTLAGDRRAGASIGLRARGSAKEPLALAASPGAHGLPGALLVVEGIDRSGRSTQVRLLEEHLRYRGRGVARTSLATSLVAGDPIRRAKSDRRASGGTGVVLLYAADLAERIEQIVVPSLRAGLIVIADRYVYTPMARAAARGLDQAWLDGIFEFAVPPDAVLFLDVPAGTALARRPTAHPAPFETGADLRLSGDLSESFRLFQDRLRRCFEEYVARYGFTPIDGTGSIDHVAALLAAEADSTLAARSGR